MQSKDEKARQELTSRWVIIGLYLLEAASSCKLPFEGCPPKAEGRMLYISVVVT